MSETHQIITDEKASSPMEEKTFIEKIQARTERSQNTSGFKRMIKLIKKASKKGDCTCEDYNYLEKDGEVDDDGPSYTKKDIKKLRKLGFQVYETSDAACLDLEDDADYNNVYLHVRWGEDGSKSYDKKGRTIEWSKHTVITNVRNL